MNIWKKLTALFLVLILLAATPAVFAAEENTDPAERLEALLDIANNVKEEKYTTETWEVLEQAVQVANDAMASGDPEQIESAVKKLASALAKLTSVKYEALEEAIAQAEQYMKENDHGFERLKNAIAQAEATYGCGNQARVDRATEEILNCLEDYRNGNYALTTEKDRSFPWGIVIACGFLLVAIVCLVVLVLLASKKKKRRTRQIDDVPLVEYDIDDDLI